MLQSKKYRGVRSEWFSNVQRLEELNLCYFPKRKQLHAIICTLIYESHHSLWAIPAVNCPTASNFKPWFVFECRCLGEVLNPAKVIFPKDKHHCTGADIQCNVKSLNMRTLTTDSYNIVKLGGRLLPTGLILCNVTAADLACPTSFWLYLMASFSRLRFMRSSSKPLLSTWSSLDVWLRITSSSREFRAWASRSLANILHCFASSS